MIQIVINSTGKLQSTALWSKQCSRFTMAKSWC